MNMMNQTRADSTKPVRILDMRFRIYFIFLLLAIFAYGCTTTSPATTTLPEKSTETQADTETITPEPTQTEEDPPTLPPTETPTETATATSTEVPPADNFDVRFHPDNNLFVGDQVSFEVISPEGVSMEGLEIAVGLPGKEFVVREKFGAFGIGDRQQATLKWVWDTAGYEAGEYVIDFSVFPEGAVFTRTVELLPESLQSFPEPDASWAIAESDCCLVYYVTGTAAARDIEILLDTADREAELAIEQLGGAFDEPITIVFLPRVLGHGGFAGSEIYISYLDRNYAGNGPSQVIHHELIHILDGRKGGELRPSIFVEGLAVYMSNGHFKQEPIVPRAASVIDLGTYIPLTDLTNNFYFAQHEISYLQGAALIDFMVQTWGWEAFETFYRDIKPAESGNHVDSINNALQTHFDISFSDLELAFIDFLNAQPDDDLAAEDIRLSVYFFDTVRRYQLALDKSAYFLTAWLLRIGEMSEKGIVADYVRHPSTPDNIAFEVMLVAADKALREGNYPAVAELLDVINRTLDIYETDPGHAFFADPIASDYYFLVQAALEDGFDPQQILRSEESGIVFGLKNSFELVELRWNKMDKEWEFAE
jgi:hypothetical protein